jgi:hypothetical protein
MFRWRYIESFSPTVLRVLLIGMISTVSLGVFADLVSPWLHADCVVCSPEVLEEFASDAEELFEEFTDRLFVETSFLVGNPDTRWTRLPYEFCTLDSDAALLELHQQRPPPDWKAFPV